MRNVLLGIAKWVILSALSASALPSLAEVSYMPPSGNKAPLITLSGQIRETDLKNFIAFARMAREDESGPTRGFYIVQLESIGGDMQTAMIMGRMLRLDKAAAFVLNNGRCFSSCVLVLAGGVMRHVVGPVGIHRPYAPNDGRVTASSQKQYYERLEKEVKAFLVTMNIPTELYDHMIRIPPERVKILTVDELQRYGLSEADPYDNAARDADTARSLGISTQELIRRKAKANSECGPQRSSELTHPLLTELTQ